MHTEVKINECGFKKSLNSKELKTVTIKEWVDTCIACIPVINKIPTEININIKETLVAV